MQKKQYSEEEQKRLLEVLNNINESSERAAAEFDDMKVNIVSASNALEEFGKQLKNQFDYSSIDAMSYKFDLLVKQRSNFMGTSFKDSEALRQSIAKGYVEIVKHGGDLNDSAKIQNLLSREFNTNTMATSKNVQDLYLSYKLSGVETGKLVKNFREAGIGIEHIGGKMSEIINYSRSVGISVNAIAGRVTENIGKLNLYNFEGGVQGLSKMAAQASLLNIDMGKTFKLAEDLLSPDKAIELSASLQRLGVTSSQLLDPLRAMDLAQNDPAELQNQLVELSQQFVRTKEDGTFEIMPGAKRHLREVASALGMSSEELANMALKSAQVEKKMSEITFPDDLASEEQKQLIANLARMGEGGEYVVDIKREEKDDLGNIIRTFTETKAVSQLDPKDIEKLVESSGNKTLEDISESQLTQLESINNKITSITTVGRVAAGASQIVPQMKDVALMAFESQYKKVDQKRGSGSEQYDELANRMNVYVAKQSEIINKMATKGDITSKDLKDLGSNLIDLVKKVGGEEFDQYIPVIKDALENIPGGEKASEIIEENKEVIGGVLVGMSTLMPSIQTLTTKLDSFVTKLGSVFGLKDFILSKGNLYSYDENDLIIGGTRLLGANQQSKSSDEAKEIVENTPQMVVEPVVAKDLIEDNISEIEKMLEQLNSTKTDYSKLTAPNQQMGSFKVDNVVLKVEDKTFPVEDKTLKVEDKVFNTTLKVEDIGEIAVKTPEPLKVEDKVFHVEDKTLKVEDKTFDVKLSDVGKLAVEDKTLKVEDKIFNVTDKVFDAKLILDNKGKLTVEDKVFKVEDKTFTAKLEKEKLEIDDKLLKVEDKTLKIEDKILTSKLDLDDVGKLAVEDKVFKVEDKVFNVVDKTFDVKLEDVGKLAVEDKVFKVEDKVFNVVDKTFDVKLEDVGKLTVEDKVFKVEDKVFNVMDKVFDTKLVLDNDGKLTVEDKVFKVEDKVFNVTDKVFDAKLILDNEGKLTVEDKVFKVEDKVFNVVDKTFDVKLEDVGKLAVEDKVFKVEDKVFNVVDKTFDVKLEDVGKLVVEDKTFKIEDKIFMAKLEKDKLEIDDKVLKVDDTPLKVEDKKFMVELEPLIIDIKNQNPEVKTQQIINQVAYTPERQIATPDVMQNTNLNRQIPTMGMVTNPEVKVSFGEMKIEISLPNLNNDPRTIDIAKNVIKSAFEDGTMKTQLSQQVVEAYNRAQNSNGVLSSNGLTNYGETKVM